MITTMPKIIILRGLPGSGKSTWAKQWIDQAPNQRKRINKDDLRAMLDNGHYTGKSEQFIIQIRDLIITECVAQGKDVVVDDTNLNPIHEKDIRYLLKSLNDWRNCEGGCGTTVKGNYTIEIKDFTDIPVEECIQRDLKRFNSVGKDVIMQMYNKYLKPKDIKNERENYLPEDPNKLQCIIVDIDGTVANNDGHRGWHDYHKVYNDKPIIPNIEIIKAVIKEFNPVTIFLSGRQDSCKEDTIEWIKDHFDMDATVSLLMRKTGDTRKDSIIKQEIYEEHIKPKYNVLVAFDDRNQVVNMWRENGIRCFQVANGNF